MKKLIVIIAVVLVASLATAGFVYAQAANPNSPIPVPGWMQGMHNQMMGGGFAGMSAMHDEVVQALAEKLGISVTDLNGQLAGGKTMLQIAQSKGWTTDQFRSWMVETQKTTLQNLVADGKLTQQQADWMNSHMSQMIANGYGPGNCPGISGNPNGASTSNGMGNMMRGYQNGQQGGMMRNWTQNNGPSY